MHMHAAVLYRLSGGRTGRQTTGLSYHVHIHCMHADCSCVQQHVDVLHNEIGSARRACFKACALEGGSLCSLSCLAACRAVQFRRGGSTNLLEYPSITNVFLYMPGSAETQTHLTAAASPPRFPHLPPPPPLQQRFAFGVCHPHHQGRRPGCSLLPH